MDQNVQVREKELADQLEHSVSELNKYLNEAARLGIKVEVEEVEVTEVGDVVRHNQYNIDIYKKL